MQLSRRVLTGGKLVYPYIYKHHTIKPIRSQHVKQYDFGINGKCRRRRRRLTGIIGDGGGGRSSGSGGGLIVIRISVMKQCCFHKFQLP
jgi:hypothetical protein